MRKHTQKNLRMNLKVKAALFLLLCLTLPAFSKNIYIKYDTECLDRYEYRLNGNAVGSGYISYYLDGATGQKIMLEVGVESIKKIKVAPKGTQSCKWLNVNEKFANRVNAGQDKVFIVRKIGTMYTVSPVHIATYLQARSKGIYSSGTGYTFEYQEQSSGYIPNDLAGFSSNFKFLYMGTADFQCMKAYTIKKIPIETCKPTTDLVIIPGIGVVAERTDVAPFSTEQNALRLESINGVPLQKYLDQTCNPRQAPVVTYRPPPPPPPVVQAPPVEYEVIQQEIPVEYVPVGAEMLFTHKSPPPVVEKYVPLEECQNVSSNGIHVVQRQETLFGIARKHNLNIAQIRDWNKLDSKSTIHPCMELKVLPNPTEAEIISYKRPEINCTQTSSPGIHVVQLDETLAGIAKKYGISVADIYKWNDLDNTSIIQVCALLVVESPAIECTQVSSSGIHIVQHKENISDIARRYSIGIGNIRAWNDLNKNDIIHPCTALKVSPPEVPVVYEEVVERIAPCSQKSSYGVHIIQPKETLTDISKRYFISIADLKKWNTIGKDDVIHPCTPLQVRPPQIPVEFEQVVKAVPCSEQSSYGVHIVQPKETLTDISERYYVSISDLKKWNKIGKNDIIRACTPLKVAPPQVPVVEKTIVQCSEKSSYGVHIVQPKETLTDIAKRYYVSVSDIKKWNRIGKSDIIKACTALNVAPPQTPTVEKTIIRCSEQSSYGVHIVQPKETLTDIAKRYYISISDIKKWNRIGKNDIIKACTALNVAPPKEQLVEKTIVRCSQQSRAGVHIVQPQETLTDIAKRYYISISDIKKWNRIGKNDIIKACSALIVTPPKAPVVEKTIIKCSEQSSAGIHIVQSKETLTDIANRYFVTINDIRRWNNLGKNEIIKACTALKVAAPTPQAFEKTIIRCSEQSSPGIHIVQPQETLTDIANRYFIAINDIRKWNRLGKNEVIKACTALKVAAPKTELIEKTIIRCSEQSSAGIHIVQPQETLTDIANRYFVTINDIRRWNKLGKNEVIKACTALKVAAPTPQAFEKTIIRCSQQSSAGIHIVQPQETLTDIANRYFIAINDIRKWNKLGKNEVIKACTALKVAAPKTELIEKTIIRCSEQSSPGIHIVQPQETLTDIANRYFVAISDIRAWNKLGKNEVIKACTALKVAAPTPQAYEKTVIRCSQQSSPGIHIVQPKETLTDIAARYYITIKDIRTWNQLGKDGLIQTCAALKVTPPQAPPVVEKTIIRCSEQSRPGVHIVQPQQTLIDIANRYFVTVNDLQKWNKLSSSDVIKACTALKVTAPNVKCPQTSYSGVHVVQVKETLTEIARRYAVGLDELRQWNNIGKDDIIRICAILKVVPPKRTTPKTAGCLEKSRPGVHIVQPSENITMIANLYSISIEEIRAWNTLDKKDIIIACMPLRVVPPQPTEYEASDRCKERSYPGIHIVQPRENITEISSQYNVSIDELRLWNNLGKADLIYPCTKLKVAPPPGVNRTSTNNQTSTNAGDYRIRPGVSYTNSASQEGTLVTKGAKNGTDLVAGICYHTVRSGETLTSISKMYGYTVDRFRAINGLKNADLLRVGQRLKTAAGCPTDDIPAIEVSGNPVPYGTQSKSKSTPSKVTRRPMHIVRLNETLSSIALRYNMTVKELRRLNNLEKGEIIIPQMKLYLE